MNQPAQAGAFAVRDLVAIVGVPDLVSFTRRDGTFGQASLPQCTSWRYPLIPGGNLQFLGPCLYRTPGGEYFRKLRLDDLTRIGVNCLALRRLPEYYVAVSARQAEGVVCLKRRHADEPTARAAYERILSALPLKDRVHDDRGGPNVWACYQCDSWHVRHFARANDGSDEIEDWMFHAPPKPMPAFRAWQPLCHDEATATDECMDRWREEQSGWLPEPPGDQWGENLDLSPCPKFSPDDFGRGSTKRRALIAVRWLHQSGRKVTVTAVCKWGQIPRSLLNKNYPAMVALLKSRRPQTLKGFILDQFDAEGIPSLPLRQAIRFREEIVRPRKKNRKIPHPPSPKVDISHG